MRQVEWLNTNAYRRYPFVEDQDLSVAGGGATFTDDVILDFQGVSYLHSQTKVRLLYFDILGTSPRQGVFTFGYEGAPAIYNPVSFTVVATAVIPYTAVAHVAVAHHLTCIFGPGLPVLLQNAPGHYVMSAVPQIEPALMLFQPNHRISNIVGTETGSVDLDNGQVFVEEGHNCQLDFNHYRNAFRISAIRGAGAGIDCDPATSDTVLCKDVLLLCNGLHGNDEGDFVLAGKDGVEVINEPDNHLIRIRTNKKSPTKCG